MNDTHPAMDSHFRRLFMAKSGEKRLRMGCSMFDAAKEIVKSAILNHDPGITPVELKKEFFLRFYGLEFSMRKKRRIGDILRQSVDRNLGNLP